MKVNERYHITKNGVWKRNPKSYDFDDLLDIDVNSREVKINNKGYEIIYLPEHKYCDNKGWVLLHRFIVEYGKGDYLERDKVVHHIDKDKLNNDIENLEVLKKNSKHLKKYHGGKK